MTIAKLKELEQAAAQGPYSCGWNNTPGRSDTHADEMLCGKPISGECPNWVTAGFPHTFAMRWTVKKGTEDQRVAQATIRFFAAVANLAPELIAVVEAAQALPDWGDNNIVFEGETMSIVTPKLLEKVHDALTALRAKLAQEKCP